MRRVTVSAAVAAVIVGAACWARAQDRADPSRAGRYVPTQLNGVLDTASGAIYMLDPLSPDDVVTLDLVGCTAMVRKVAKDASGWGAVELPKLDPAVIPARASLFVASPDGKYVVDTRTGAEYTLEGAANLKFVDMKDVKVVRLDPVLGTRVVRDLHVSRRGG